LSDIQFNIAILILMYFFWLSTVNLNLFYNKNNYINIITLTGTGSS